MQHTELLRKIAERSATVGIIGLGYVGLPLALTVVEAGFKRVIGFDVDPQKIHTLKTGGCYIKHLELSRVQNAVENGLTATADFSLVAEVDVLILCVPTPLTRHREPDMRFIINTLSAIQPHIHAGMMISLESTTYPGTTEEFLVPTAQRHKLTPGKDIFLVYSPEREDPGNKQYSTASIPKVCGGVTEQCLAAGTAFYRTVVKEVVPVSSTKAAEMTKLLENIHRAVNIGLVNEMKIVADKMGINIHEVIDAAATKPFGFTKFTPGPGLGGHCIPIDPFYLTWKAREYGINTRFIELAGEVNRAMPEWVVGKLMDALNDQGKALKGSKILVLGIAYKKNIDDARESPAIRIMELLRDKGAEVAYSDPHIPVFPKMRDHHFELTSIEPTAATVTKFDALVLTTNHDQLNLGQIFASAKLVIDTQNTGYPGKNIVSA
ncbi:nucleotide sugar dehydrogenase [Halioxenophilus sp. WMMB6]|uniref:nucleotide sugar dehydrogenase n=1 Tax=Halioxenophilus sp. WMMB6 TaxID=3073815 RepID=UPI00295F10E5|nr:nucleotide sugar dehydrogenase [Halioxenophilus sp. WMMB6]